MNKSAYLGALCSRFIDIKGEAALCELRNVIVCIQHLNI